MRWDIAGIWGIGFISGRIYPWMQGEISSDRLVLGVIVVAVSLLPVALWGKYAFGQR